MKRVLLYGAIGGALVALLQWIEYEHFIRAFGLKWTRPKEVVRWGW